MDRRQLQASRKAGGSNRDLQVDMNFVSVNFVKAYVLECWWQAATHDSAVAKQLLHFLPIASAAPVKSNFKNVDRMRRPTDSSGSFCGPSRQQHTVATVAASCPGQAARRNEVIHMRQGQASAWNNVGARYVGWRPEGTSRRHPVLIRRLRAHGIKAEPLLSRNGSH